VRVDLLDVALQVARAVDDQDDEDLVTFERVAGELDDTGLFLDLALDDVGTLDTVLAEDPAVTVGVRELLDLASTFFGEVGGSMFDSERQLEQVGGIVGGDDVPVEDRVAAGSGVFGTGTGGAGLQPQDLRVGDCIAEVTPGTDDVAPEEAVVPCDRPHAGEVIALVTADADRLEDADLAGSVYDRCEDAFVDYVGAQLIDTDLFIELLLPSPGRFEQGAREVACTVTTFTSPLTGSVADTGR
jgi:hypothetical protein